MANITYGLTKEKYILGSKSRISYGIAAYADAEIDGTAIVVAHIGDITSERKKLLALIQTCNRLRLSPLHLQEMVEDFLSQTL